MLSDEAINAVIQTLHILMSRLEQAPLARDLAPHTREWLEDELSEFLEDLSLRNDMIREESAFLAVPQDTVERKTIVYDW